MISRRTLLKSAAALVGLALVPKVVKAAVKSDNPLAPLLNAHYEPIPEVQALVKQWYDDRLTGCHASGCEPLFRGYGLDGLPRMDLIDKDHVPEGTKLREWVFYSDYAPAYAELGMTCPPAHVYPCGDDMYIDDGADCMAGEMGFYGANGRVDTIISLYNGRLAYNGPHPIYQRLFPMPTTTS